MRVRVAAAILYVFVVGAASLDVEFIRDLPDEFGYGIWPLGIAVGFVAGRRWVLWSALTPVVVAAYLAAIGHDSPTSEGGAVGNLFLSPIAVAFVGVPVLIGLGLRKGWDARRRQGAPGSGSSPAAVSR